MISIYDRIFYAPKEVASMLNVSLLTIYKWIYRERLAAIKTANNRWVIEDIEVAKLLGIVNLQEAAK